MRPNASCHLPLADLPILIAYEIMRSSVKEVRMSDKDNFKTEFFDKKTRHTDEKAVPLDKEDVS